VTVLQGQTTKYNYKATSHCINPLSTDSKDSYWKFNCLLLKATKQYQNLQEWVGGIKIVVQYSADSFYGIIFVLCTAIEFCEDNHAYQATRPLKG